jgi:hypothetical protein
LELLSGREQHFSMPQLRQENRTLKQRLEKKDKHIQEMMYHTEKIASGLAEQNNGRTNHGS